MVNHVNHADSFRGSFLYRSQGLPFSGISLRRYHFDIPSIHTKIQGEKSVLPEIVCKVEKVRSTFHTFHDYLNFYGEKKDDRLFIIYVLKKIEPPYSLYLSSCRAVFINTFCPITRRLSCRI